MTSFRRDLVFVSYSHQDATWLERVLKFLKPYTRQGELSIWADPYIKTGDLWRREIDGALERAAVGLCLVSQDFLASDFITNVEVPALLDAAERDLLTVFAVPLSSSTYTASDLKHYQWARSPDEPLDLLEEAHRNRALVEITNRLVAAAQERIGAPARSIAPARRATREAVEPVDVPAEGKCAELHGVPPLPPHYLSRAEDLARLKRALLEGTDGAVGITAAAYRLGLHGQGGIGKSVLAAALARNEEVRRAFPDGVHWIAVGQEPDVLRLQEALVSQLAPGEPFAVRSVEEGRAALEKRFEGRSCLLVVDDVWDVRHARAFDALSPRSRLLVTTRDGAVLTALGAKEEEIERLPEAAALELLASWADEERGTLPGAAADVAGECGYLPLALSVVGAWVRDGISWEEALVVLKRGTFEFPDHPYGNVFRSMRLSVDALPDDERQRYLELAVFPEEERVPESMVLKLWRRTGGLDSHQAKFHLAKLERKALLEVTVAAGGREIVLHDLQHDFLRILVEDLPALHDRLLEALAEGLPPADGAVRGWHALPPDERYPWVRLGEHLFAAGRVEEFNELLLDYRWLEAKLQATGVSALLSDFAAFPHDRDLALVAGALRLSAHILGPDPDQLPSQLTGRLQGMEEPRIRSLVAAIRLAPSRPWLRPLTPSLEPPTTGLLRTLAGHSGWVTAVALMADGRRAVSGSDDGTLKVWDVETGEVVRTLAGHAGGVWAVALTADGRRAVSGSRDGTLKVWELETGEEVRTLAGHSGVVTAVALTADRRWAVSGSGDGTLKVWELETGEEVCTLAGHLSGVMAVALTADGRRAVSGSWDGTLKVWEVETGEEIRALARHSRWVTAVALTADGRWAISGSLDGTLTVWEVETGEEVRTLAGHSHGVRALALTADGRRVVYGSEDGTLKVWEVETREEVCTLVGHSAWVRAVTLSADGRRAVSGSLDGTLTVWEVGAGEEVRTLAGHSHGVRALALTADGRLVVSGSEDRTLKVWEVETGEEVRTLAGHSRWVTAVALTADGRLVASGSDDRTLKVWEVETGEEVRTLAGHLSEVTAVALTADGRRAVSGSCEKTLKVWELETGKEVCALAGHLSEVTAVALTADGRRAVSGSIDGTLKVWEVETGEEIRTLAGHSGRVNSVAVTADGRWAVFGSTEGELKVWEVETCREMCTLVDYSGWIRAVAVTPDGRWVVSGSDYRTIRLWDLAGQRVTAFFADASVRCCGIAPDGRTIVAGDALGRVHFLRLEGIDADAEETH